MTRPRSDAGGVTGVGVGGVAVGVGGVRVGVGDVGWEVGVGVAVGVGLDGVPGGVAVGVAVVGDGDAVERDGLAVVASLVDVGVGADVLGSAGPVPGEHPTTAANARIAVNLRARAAPMCPASSPVPAPGKC